MEVMHFMSLMFLEACLQKKKKKLLRIYIKEELK